MKQIVAYCDKTEQKTQKNINETETILKQQLKKEDYQEIKNTITSNETEEQPKPTKPSYAQALKSNVNTFEKVNSPNHHENKPNKNINERLRSLSPANRRSNQGIIRSKNNSKTDVSSSYKYQQEIKQLKEEIKLLKQTKNNHQEETKEIKTSNRCANSKNEFQASVSRGGQEENIELINLINFIEQTMTSLSSYGKRLKTQLDFNLTQQDK